jgi:hypothetical protein
MLLRHAELRGQSHSFGFRHVRGDLLQEVEALIRKDVSHRVSSASRSPWRFTLAASSPTRLGSLISCGVKRVELTERIIVLA